MNEKEYFLKAITHACYLKMHWVRSILCITNEGPDDYKDDPYSYRLVVTRNGFFYIDPEKNGELTQIETKRTTAEPLLDSKDVISIKKGQLVTANRDIEKTTVGNVLINAIALHYPFGGKIPFQEGQLSVGKIENLILEKLTDNPKEGEERKDDLIYVDEYIKFTEAMLMIRNMSGFIIPAATKVNMTPPPGVIEYRNQLLEENKDRLTDPAVLAEIDKKLLEYDAKYLAEDPEGLGFLQKKKLKQEVRRKLFLTFGGVNAFGDGTTVTDVPKSLSEGIDIDKLPAMNSESRAGSYNRGHQTMLGGAKFKELIRAAANVRISEDDCGTRIGTPEIISKDHYKNFIGRYVITSSGDELLTEESIQKYLGKSVMIRSPKYCKSEKTDYCKHCIGEKLSLHPTAVSVAVSDVGSAFLSLFLKKMHVSGMTTEKMDFMEEIH